MSAFKSLADIPPLPIWQGVLARAVEGREVTFAIVELEPDSVVGQHQHPNEQVGIILKGSLRFNIGDESRDLRAGDTYVIPSGIAHGAIAGPEGAVVIDVFAPVRSDWRTFEPGALRPPKWP
jgi:quercetin dioxygenase-like cupin family protein